MTEGPAPNLLPPDLDDTIYDLVDARHGRFVTLRHDTFVSRSLLRYGEWCEAEITLLKQIVTPGMIVVDAGANVGAHTLAFAQMVGANGRVFAFEPQPVVHRALSANVFLNGALQVTALNMGLGAKRGAVRFAEIDYRKPMNVGAVTLEQIDMLSAKAGGLPVANIPVLALDEALSLPRLDLIKADIEGMEPEMLQGAVKTIAAHRPLLYLECEDRDAAEPLFSALSKIEYEAYWHLSPLYLAANWREDAEDIFGGVVCVNLFCAPKGRNVAGLLKAKGPEDHPRPSS